MTEFYRTNPYYEPPLDDEGDVGSEIPSGNYLHRKQSERLTEYHTGNKDTYLSHAEETKLAELIQDGIKAKEEREAIEELSEFTPGDVEQLRTIYARIKAGREAKQTLVEANMRFAAYYARASVGIVNQKSPRPKPASKTSGRYKGKNKKPKKIGTYTDIRNFRSPHAQLEDRTQVAYLGLIRAADNFKPWEHTTPTEPSEGADTPTAFTTYAASTIQGMINVYTHNEPPGWYIPLHIAKEIKDYRQKSIEDLQTSRTPTYDPRLEGIIQGTETIPLDDIMFDGAPEEADDNMGNSRLNIAELLPDDIGYVEEIAIKHDLELRISEVIATLPAREADIIRRRFGFLDGRMHLLSEIADLHNITKEYVGKLESRSLSRLRHPSRADSVRDYKEEDALRTTPYYSGDNIRTPRLPVTNTAHVAAKAIEVSMGLESWQATSQDTWDEPVRTGIIDYEDEETIAYELVERGFDELLLNINPYHFQKSFEESVGSLYPTALIEQIDEIFGKSLKPAHIEKFWNTHLEAFLDKIHQSVGDDFSYDRFSQLFAGLLCDRMTEEDDITLDIPSTVDGKLTYMGAWQKYGSLTINGNVGDHTAHQASGLASITINGNAGTAVAAQISGMASVHVTGSVKDMVGFEASGRSYVVIDGEAGDFAGACTKSEASVVVRGNSGDYAACEINSNSVIIKIEGNTGYFFGDKSTRGNLILTGHAASVSTDPSFSGNLTLEGKRIQ